MDRLAGGQVRCWRRAAQVASASPCLSQFQVKKARVPRFELEDLMLHKYRLGQSVRYFGAPFGARAGDLEFTIVALLPEASYRIKAVDEPTERVAREYELRPTAESNGC
jgi:hypothetical protein